MVLMMKPTTHPLKTSLHVVILLAVSGLAHAERWQIVPSVQLEERYDDNITLSPTNPESALGSFLKGQLAFSRLTEISTIEGRLSVEYSYYDDPPASVKDDNTNVYFDLDSEFRTELSRYGLLALIRRDTTLRFAESLENETPGDIESPDDPITEGPDIADGIDLDRGLVQQEIERETLSVSPYWSLDLDERSSIELSYRFTDVNYKKNPSASGIFDYESHDLTSAYEFNVSERDTLGVGVSVGQFKSPDNSNNTVDTYSIKGLYSRRFSQTLDGALELGVNHYKQESDASTTTNEADGVVFGMTLNKHTETDRYSVSFLHNIQPSGDGTVSETSQLNLNGRRALSERLAIFAALGIAETERVGESNSKREYLYFSPRLEWKMTQEWTLGAGYRYTRNDVSTTQSADSNSFSLSLRYTEPYFIE